MAAWRILSASLKCQSQPDRGQESQDLGPSPVFLGVTFMLNITEPHDLCSALIQEEVCPLFRGVEMTWAEVWVVDELVAHSAFRDQSWCFVTDVQSTVTLFLTLATIVP